MIDHTPFMRCGVTLITLDTYAERERTRRLQPGERQRLLEHAAPHLQALIIAALSTGCRRGELLSLQWSQLQRDEQGDTQVIVLPASQQDQDARPPRHPGVVRVTCGAGDAADRSDGTSVAARRLCVRECRWRPTDGYQDGMAESPTSISMTSGASSPVGYWNRRRTSTSCGAFSVTPILRRPHGTCGVRRCGSRRRWSGWRRQPRPSSTLMTSRIPI